MTTPQTLPYGTSIGTGPNAVAWAEAILAGLGAPQTAANVNSLVDWMDQEGGGGVNNPLNVANASGATGTINSAGVNDFGSPQAGVAATVARLENPFASTIVAALRSGQGLIGNKNVSGALSQWSGGGYDTIGSAGTVKGVQGNVPGVSAPGAAPSGGTSGPGVTGTGPDPNAPGGIIGFGEGLPVIGGLFKAIEPLFHAAAVVIDYSFAMFQPGQGQRFLFALAAIVLAYLAYRVISGSGTAPHLPGPAAVIT